MNETDPDPQKPLYETINLPDDVLVDYDNPTIAPDKAHLPRAFRALLDIEATIVAAEQGASLTSHNIDLIINAMVDSDGRATPKTMGLIKGLVEQLGFFRGSISRQFMEVGCQDWNYRKWLQMQHDCWYSSINVAEQVYNKFNYTQQKRNIITTSNYLMYVCIGFEPSVMKPVLRTLTTSSEVNHNLTHQVWVGGLPSEMRN